MIQQADNGFGNEQEIRFNAVIKFYKVFGTELFIEGGLQNLREEFLNSSDLLKSASKLGGLRNYILEPTIKSFAYKYVEPYAKREICLKLNELRFLIDLGETKQGYKFDPEKEFKDIMFYYKYPYFYSVIFGLSVGLSVGLICFFAFIQPNFAGSFISQVLSMLLLVTAVLVVIFFHLLVVRISFKNNKAFFLKRLTEKIGLIDEFMGFTIQ